MNLDWRLAFFGFCGVLMIVLALEFLPGAPLPHVRPPPVPHAVQEGDAAEIRNTDEWADTVLARPLFAPDRKPPRQHGGPAIVAANGMPRLSGIMITPAGRRAIFMPDGGKPLVLAEGAALQDGTIARIQADRVVLNGPKGELVLRPSYDSKRAIPGLMGGMTAPVFQPNLPVFPNPVFSNQGVPPGFPQPQPPQPQADDTNDGPSTPQPMVAPVFRPNMPRGRE